MLELEEKNLDLRYIFIEFKLFLNKYYVHNIFTSLS